MQVLRALPAETKVDGLPRDSSLLIPQLGLNEIKMASKLHMYLDSCKGASLYIDMARSYQTNKVRHMRADLWKVRFSSFEARIQHRIQVSEDNLVC